MEARAEASATLAANFDVRATVDYEESFSDEFLITELKKPFMVLVCGVPIYGDAYLRMYLGVEGGGELHGEAGGGYDITFPVNVGMQYQRGVWMPIEPDEPEFNEHAPYVYCDANAYLKAWVRPEIEVVVTGNVLVAEASLDATLDVAPYARLDGDFHLTPTPPTLNYALNAGVTSDASCSLVVRLLFNEYEVIDEQLRLFEWETDPPLVSGSLKWVEADFDTDPAPPSGDAPLEVTFTNNSTCPVPPGTFASAWDFDDDGIVDSTAVNPTYTYNSAGNYNCRLAVTDSWGISDMVNRSITVSGGQNQYTVSGNVENEVGSGVGDVEISFDGETSGSITTEQQGSWAFTAPAGLYSITPSRIGWTFTPSHQDISVFSDTEVPGFNAWHGPIADLTATPDEGNEPLEVFYDASGSYDPDGGTITNFRWDWDGDGTYDYQSGTDPTVSHVFSTPGEYSTELEVEDNEGETATVTSSIVVHGWINTVVRTVGNVGKRNSIAVVNGRPAIAYYDSDDHSIYFIRAANESGTSWGAPVYVAAVAAGDISTLCPMRIINGRPAIAYFYFLGNQIKYVRALDDNGTSWGTPVVVDAISPSGYPFLNIVNEHPAISYYDRSSQLLKYCSASDIDGVSWNTPVSVTDIGAGDYLPNWSSVEDVNGYPAIAYHYDADAGGDFGGLRYIRATNSEGTNWGSPIDLFNPTGYYVGSHITLMIQNGNPAILYDTQGAFAFNLRANDVNGSDWPDGAGIAIGVATNLSACKYNEFAAIAFHNRWDHVIGYAFSGDLNGTSWTPGVIIEENSEFGGDTSITVYNNVPMVSYHIYDTDDLGFGIYY